MILRVLNQKTQRTIILPNRAARPLQRLVKHFLHILSIYLIKHLLMNNCNYCINIGQCRRIAVKLRKSPNSKARFIEICQEAQCEKPHIIERDVPTRWNSTYMQLSSIVRCEEAV
jgi:hypothetical protein